MRKRKKSLDYSELEKKLPEGWKIHTYHEGSEYAIVKIRTDDIEKIKLLKLPEGVREYFKKKQKEYRKRLKKKQTR